MTWPPKLELTKGGINTIIVASGTRRRVCAGTRPPPVRPAAVALNRWTVQAKTAAQGKKQQKTDEQAAERL